MRPILPFITTAANYQSNILHEIGRRVYRDGGRVFHHKHLRLQDIHDLFIDTGMGSDAYSVIELKMIEQILSETAEDENECLKKQLG